MKHPTLIRVFASVLAVLCLVMLLAGGAGITSALGDREQEQEALARLEDRVEEYRIVTEALQGGISYEQAQKTLEARQEQHDEDASQHRMDLAEYTATKGGITAGVAALDEAQAALDAGLAQYEAGLALFEEQAAAFEEGYQQFLEGKQQLEAGWEQYNNIAALVSSARAQFDNLQNLGAILDSEEPDARLQFTLQAFDSAFSAYDQALGLVEILKGQGYVTDEQLAQVENAIASAVGMSSAEIRQTVQAARDQAAATGEGVMTEEQFELLKALYDQNRELIARAAAAAGEKLAEVEGTLAETYAQLEAAQAEIDKLEVVMEEGRKGIEQGRLAMEQAAAQIQQGGDALYAGRAQIWYQLGELEKKAEELRQEKAELEADADALEGMELDAKERKELEKRQTSLRLTLTGYEEIKALADEGVELADAADQYAVSLAGENARMFSLRLTAYILMLAGAVAGFLGIPAAYEKMKGRFMLVAAPAVCFACAAAAELICELSGRGSTYSAIGVMIFAAVQLIILIPELRAKVKTV